MATQARGHDTSHPGTKYSENPSAESYRGTNIRGTFSKSSATLKKERIFRFQRLSVLIQKFNSVIHQDDLWTFRLTDTSPDGRTFRPIDVSPHGRLAPQTIRPTDDVNINNQQRPRS